MADYTRTQRIGDQIQRELASLIQLEMKDPRLGMVTVSAVNVSRDMGFADVYVTVLEHKEQIDREQTLAILNKGAGFLRGRLGQLIKLRVVPALRFHYDESIARGQRLSALIDQAVREDKARSGESLEGN